MKTKKIILFILIIFGCCAASLKSQPLMTNAEIYDFNIGDVFERKIGGYYYGNPTYYSLDTIINKYYSAGMDTVFYVVNSYGYTSPGCPPCTGSSSSSFGNISYYTNLKDTVGKGLGKKPYNLNCIDTTGYTGTWVDTTYHDLTYCNTITTTIKYINNGPQLNGTCYWYFEPYNGYDIYGKGLGYVIHYYNTCSNGFPNCEQGMELIYYKKGSTTCGTYSPIYITGIKQIMENTSELIAIYPNPTNSIFTVQTNTIDKQVISLYDISGRLLFSQNLVGAVDIDVSNFNNGVYTLLIKSSSRITNKKIVITH